MIRWNSRDELPHLLNDLGLLGEGVEVGTQRGHFAAHLRRHWHGSKLLCVDPYAPYPGLPSSKAEHEDCLAEARRNLDRTGRPYSILREYSAALARRFREDGVGFDFVYIDGDHEYDSVIEDILAWYPLVRSGGIIAGHDYVKDGWHRHGDAINGHETRSAAGEPASLFGVMKAVNEFFRPDEIVLTSPDTDGGWRSWLAVRR